MITLVDKNELWLYWHSDEQWKGWWWLSCDCSLSSYRETRTYVPLPEDNALSLAFSKDPRELLVRVWTNATSPVMLEVFHGLDLLELYEGPFTIKSDDLGPVIIRLQAILESKSDSISYSLKGVYRDPLDHRLHGADPKFTISRSG